MDDQHETGRCSIWDSFQTKVEDMFVTGYNLPESLQATAVTNVEEKLVVWKEKLAQENGENQDLSPVSPAGFEDCDIAEVETPVSRRSSRAAGTKSSNRAKNVSSVQDSEDVANEEHGNDMDADTSTVAEAENNTEEPTEGDKDVTDLQTPQTTPRKRGRGRPRKDGSTSRKSQEKGRASLELKVKQEKDSGHEEDSSQTSTPTSTKRRRGRPPGSKNTPKTPKSALQVKIKTEKEDSTEGEERPQRKRGRPSRLSDTDYTPQGEQVKQVYSCNTCERKYSTKDRLQKHLLIHKNGPIKCAHCPKTFMSQSGYEVHSRLHTGVGLNRCPYCTYLTGSSGMLTSHVKRVHEKQKKHLCDTCGKGFVTNYMLKRHIEAIHMKDVFKNFYSCDFCTFKTHSDACLKSHIRNRHTTMPGFMCNLCGVTLKYKHSLQEHQQRHYSDKKASCPECPFKAICDADIRKHIRRHHRETKTYQCEVCNKNFKQKVHLIRHSNVHTGAKDHICSQCSYRCNDKSNLAKHMWHVHKLKERTKPVLVKLDQLEAVLEPAKIEDGDAAAALLQVEAATEDVIIEEQTEIVHVQPIVMTSDDTQYEVVQNIEYWS